MKKSKRMKTAGILYICSGLLMFISALVGGLEPMLAIGPSLIILGLVFLTVAKKTESSETDQNSQE